MAKQKSNLEEMTLLEIITADMTKKQKEVYNNMSKEQKEAYEKELCAAGRHILELKRKYGNLVPKVSSPEHISPTAFGLWKDGLISERKFVSIYEEHLKECSMCNKAYKQYKKQHIGK
ncbi:MAG: hypothetical protein KKE23_00345 [Nanoarchaeota archaeon]|nr:hypothetical protein [Nanoarchaeota archaeon]